MRLVFLGSGAFGLPTLQALHSEHEVAAVVSQPDRPAGRKRVLTPTPIATWAAEQGFPVLKFEDVNAPEAVAAIADLAPEAAVVIAFGQKLSPSLIGALGRLAVNLHASLLPKYRGAAPINWAMIHGERETGVSVIGLAQRMDAGSVYATAVTLIDPLETAGELHDRLAALGPAAVGGVLADLQAGTLEPQVQDDAVATKAPKLSKADGVVDWSTSATAIRQRIHGLTPWPGVRVTWRREATADGTDAGKSSGDGEVLILHRVADEPDASHNQTPGTVLPDARIATGAGAIRLLELQAPGGKVMPIDAFMRGRPLTPGDQFV